MYNNRLKKIIFLVTFLMVAFFIGHYSSAANNNTVFPICASDPCDTDAATCSEDVSGGQWTSNGYPSGAGNPSCCGDDSQEFYTTRQVNTSVYSLVNSASDNACCNLISNCVYEGECYRLESELDRGTMGNDRYILCEFSGAEYYDWTDCDWGGTCPICGGSLIKAGESSVGEYMDTSTAKCCGDDNGEYYITAYCSGYSGGPKCCNSGSDRIDASGNCVSSCPAACGDNAQSSSVEWDYNSTLCTPSKWGLTTGNASGSCWNGMCCGDDTGEYRILSLVGHSDGTGSYYNACCQASTLCTGSTGACYPINYYTNADNSGGDEEKCIGVNWYDQDKESSICKYSWMDGNVASCHLGNGACDDWDFWDNPGPAPAYGETRAFCCGDDTNEKSVPSCSGTANAACCPSTASYYNETTNACVSTCNVAPGSFNLSSPANNATMVAQKPTLSWSASTDPNGDAVTYNVYYCCATSAGCTLPSSPNTSVSGTSYTFSSNLTLGNYCNWNVVASDGTLQTISANGPFSFRVDQAPNTPSNPIPANGDNCQAAKPTLSWQGGDPDVGDTLTYEVRACTGASCTPISIGSTSATSYTPASAFANSATIRWQIVASDSKGITTAGPVWQFTTVPVTPTATITDGASGSCVASDTLTASWSNGATPGYAYSSDAVCNSSDGPYTSGSSVTVSTTHADYLCFNNVAASCSVTGYSAAQGPLRVDASAPTISSVTASSPSCNTITFAINGAADVGCAGLATSAYSFDAGANWQSGSSKNFTGTSYTLAAGQIKVKDVLGNTYTYNNSISGTANSCDGPIITFNPTSRAYNYTDVSVAITATDADGVNGTGDYCWTTGASCTPATSFSLGSSVSQSVSGEWTLCARVSDTGGTSSTSCSGPYRIDKIAPSITKFEPNDNTICSGATVTFTWDAVDTGGSDISQYEFWQKPSGGSWSQVSGCSELSCVVNPTVTTQYGLHVKDAAGNCIAEDGSHCGGVSSDSLDDRTSYGPDSVVVSTVPSAPGNPTYSSPTANSTTVTWTPPTSGANSYNIYRCTGATCTRLSTPTYTGKTSPFTDSSLNCNTTYRYWIEAVNDCGSTFSAQGTTVTTSACTAPSITFNPASRVWASSDASVAVSAIDSAGISYVRYCLTADATCDPGTTAANNSPFTCGGTSPCSATVTQSNSGSWNLCVRARNTTGNWSSAICSGPYQVDKIRPTINSLTVEGAAVGGAVVITTTGQKPTVIWDITENESGFNKLELWRAPYNASTCNGTTMTGCSWGSSALWIDSQEDNATGRDDTTAVNGGDYWYGVHAFDNVDNCAYENNVACGATGNPIRVTLNYGGTSCTSAPGQPTNLAHTANTTNSITWQWNAPAGDPVAEYRIYNNAAQLIGTSVATSYTQTAVQQGGASLAADTQYTVYVVPVNACGTGPASALASAYTSANAPTSCSGSAVSSSAINWSWVSGGSQSGFYASNSAGNTNWITGTSWSQATGLVCNTAYNTTVKARNHDGEETASVQCSATTLTCSGSGGPLAAGFQWCAANTNTLVFLDSSTGGVGGVTGWTWNFGDSQICPTNSCTVSGYNGSNQYPVHQYASTPPADWWNTSWTYRQKITFDNSGRSALTNFSVLIKIVPSNTNFWSHVKNNSLDVRFVDADNATELYYQMEKWDYNNKEYLVWVKVPQIDGTNSDHIYIYYGNSSALISSYFAPTGLNVWDSNYKLVWHLNQASGHSLDSSGNNISSTSENGLTYYASGQIGYGIGFADGYTASDLNITSNATLNQDPFTWEAWLEANQLYSNTWYWQMGDATTYVDARLSDGSSRDFEVQHTMLTPTYVRKTDASFNFSANTWYHLVVEKYTTGNNRVKVYKNGALWYEGGGTNLPSGTITWGPWKFGGEYFGGTMDEIRISAGNRSADWLAFEYCNMMQTCTAYGSEENKNGSLPSSYSVVLTAQDSAANTDQSIQTVYLDPVNYGCSPLGCESACYTPTACSTAQCDNNANGFRYQQTRVAACPDNCHCPAWSAYQSCQDSYNNCPDSAPYSRVQCYTGAGCNTATNACTCEEGYESDGAGGCQLKPFTFDEVRPLGATQLSLRWQRQTAATSYFVTRGGLIQETTCSSDPCYYTDTGLSAGTTYTYYILARVGSLGIYNSTASPNPNCPGTYDPNAICPLSGTTDSVVSGFTLTPACGQLTLNWNNLNVGGVTDYSYNIYKSTVGPSDLGTLLRQISASSSPSCANEQATCTLIDKEVMPQVSYYYTIVTEKGGVTSTSNVKANAKSYCYEAPGWEER